MTTLYLNGRKAYRADAYGHSPRVNKDDCVKLISHFDEFDVIVSEKAALKYDASEAIAKIKAYDNVTHYDHIEVGDEVIAPRGKAVVTLIETDDLVHYLYSGGDYGCIEPQKLKKTGKHYDIQSILEAMRNDR